MIREKKHSSNWQTVLSLAVLTILIIICAGVIIAQYSYNPAVLQKDALLPTAEKISRSAPLSSDKSFLPLPQGMVPLTTSEVFEAQNLSDKINGKAELYLSAGFARLVSQRFKDERMSDLWIEVFIYDMANGHNAFSVFSAQPSRQYLSSSEALSGALLYRTRLSDPLSDVELIFRIKELLYEERYTINGARKKLKELGYGRISQPELLFEKVESKSALDQVIQELKEIQDLLSE